MDEQEKFTKMNNNEKWKPKSEKEIIKEINDKMDKEKEEREGTLHRILDSIESDESKDAWDIREAFILSVKNINEEISSLTNSFNEVFKPILGDKNILDLKFDEQYKLLYKDEDSPYRKNPVVKEIYTKLLHKEIVKSEILKLLAQNVANLYSEKSLNFREKLLELGCHIRYLLESIKDVCEENPEANKLADRFIYLYKEYLDSQPGHKGWREEVENSNQNLN